MYYKWFQEYVLYMYIVHVLYINVIGYMLSTNWGIYVSCECKLYIVHWKLDISSGGYMSVANVNCTLYIGSWIYHKGGGGNSNHTILLQWLSSHHVILWSLPCPDVPEMFRLLGCYEMLYTVNVTQIISVRLLWNVVCSKCHTDNFWTMYWGPVSGSHVARSSSVLYLTREG